MDPITQALLGATVAQAACAKKLKQHAFFIGAIGGIVADLDIFIRSSQNPLLLIMYHRHFSHSLIFIPLGGLLVALLYLLFIKAVRPRWGFVLMAAILAYASHGLLDAFTAYGTLLLWPFSHTRIAWNILPIIDPVFSIILLLGVYFSLRKKSNSPALIALGCVAIYITFAAWQHHRAVEQQQILAQQRQQTIIKSQVMPNVGGITRWRSIYISQQRIYFDSIYTPLFGKSMVKTHINLPLATSQSLPANIKAHTSWLKDFKTFLWFCNGFAATLSQQPLIIIDSRYIFATQPLTALWAIEFPSVPSQTHVIFKQRIVLSSKYDTMEQNPTN